MAEQMTDKQVFWDEFVDWMASHPHEIAAALNKHIEEANSYLLKMERRRARRERRREKIMYEALQFHISTLNKEYE
jgi:hypothetical protein